MKTLLLFSGGLDSTVLLHYLTKTLQREVKAMIFSYGQRHAKEVETAQAIATRAGAPFEVIDIGEIGRLLQRSRLLNGYLIPHGRGYKSMQETAVPHRNLTMLSIAAAHGASDGYGEVAFGALKDSLYPDCSEDFVAKMDAVIAASDFQKPPVTITTPFIRLTKSDVVSLGVRLDINMGETWSCYEGGEKHCGKCGTCLARREAFRIANVHDDTPYE